MCLPDKETDPPPCPVVVLRRVAYPLDVALSYETPHKYTNIVRDEPPTWQRSTLPRVGYSIHFLSDQLLITPRSPRHHRQDSVELVSLLSVP